jgi:polysaccharide biosynthesis protein PslH
MMRGDQLTVAHLISYLHARGHEVDFFSLKLDGELSSEQAAWLSSACAHVCLYKHTLFDKVRGVLLGLARGLPLQVGLFDNQALKRDVKARFDDGRYDVVYTYYVRSAPASPGEFKPFAVQEIKSRKVVSFLAMQLSQVLNVERIFRSERPSVKKAVYWFEWLLFKRFEARIWSKYTRAVLIGPKDVEAVKVVCREQGQPEISNWVYGAHGTDVERLAPASPSEIVAGRVVFSGSMLYQPNIQAVLWFVRNCWSEIRRQIPTATFYVQGRDPVPEILALDGKDGVVVTGTVPDVGAIIRSAAVCINPMLAAGGMQNKLVEYMASGKAIVATSVANEGIQSPPDNLVIADTPSDFSAAVIDLLKDPARGQVLGTAARSFVVQNWTWEAHFQKLEQEFVSALRSEVAA